MDNIYINSKAKEEAEDVKEYVVNSKELAMHINSMANVECHEVAPTAELKRLAEIIGEALRKKRGGER